MTGLLVTLGLMAAARFWTYAGPRRSHVVTGPVFAAGFALVGHGFGVRYDPVAGVWWAVGGAGAVVVAYAIGVLVPVVRRALRDRPPDRTVVFDALVGVPLATVLLEEVAFRGVLWGLLEMRWGPAWATGISALLFGLWHVERRPPLTVLGIVAFTAAAGVVLALLREVSGGLLAPIAVHWAANSLGLLVPALLAANSSAPRDPGR